MQFSVTPGCEILLAEEGERYEAQMRQIFTGHGVVTTFTAQDWVAEDVPHHLRQTMSDYLKLNSRGHRALFYLLPNTVGHLFPTEATTYLDNPTSHFKISKDGVWLAFESPEKGARIPLHKVVLSHFATDISIAHETFHLVDMEQIFAYVESHLSSSQRIIIRLDLFRFVTELIAYKKTYRAFEGRGSATVAAEIAVASMENDFIPALRSLKKSERDVVLRAFGLKDLSRQALLTYVANREPIPEIMSVIEKFGPEGFRIVQI